MVFTSCAGKGTEKALGWANESEVYLTPDCQRLACLVWKTKP